jgi:hypothetical protein
MKNLFPFLCFAALLPAAAQVAINSDGSAPDASAMLEITSNSSGVLIPRMTAAQRDAIPTPATGLMVYVTDDNLFHFYNGSAWTAINPSGGNSTDELQTLSRSGTDVTLSDGGGTVSIADNDNSSSNELQNLGSTASGTNRTVTITNGSNTTFSVADNDNDATNELDSKWTEANNAIHHNAGEVGIGTNDPEALLHLSSGTQSDATGIKMTQENANSLIYHNDGDLILRKFSEADQLVLDAGGNVGIGTANPGQALDVNGQVRIRGGGPGAGRVLTSTDGNGNATWSDPAIPDLETSTLEVIGAVNGSGGWSNLGTAVDLDDLRNGDQILVLCSFLLLLDGGSGTDEADFRIAAENLSTSNTQTSMRSGVIEYLERDSWVMHSFHRVITINKGAGNYRFRMEVNQDLYDDPLKIDQHQITVIKF